MKTLKQLAILAAGCAALGLAMASPALAVTVTIGLDVGSGIVQVATNSGSLLSGATYTNLNYSGWNIQTISGTGNPPASDPYVLSSNTLDIGSSGGGSIKIYISSQGNSSPYTDVLNFISSFQSNGTPGGFTITENTYIDLGNAQWGTGALLGTATWNTAGNHSDNASTVISGITGDYSVLTEYVISSTKAGTINPNVGLTAVPLPAAFPLFAAGLFGVPLVGSMRRRRSSQPA